MFWLGLAVAILLPLLLPVAASGWADHVAGLGVVVGMAFWLLDRENGLIRILPILGFLSGVASLWLGGLFAFWPSVLLPVGALVVVYLLSARHPTGDPGPAVLVAVPVALAAGLFLLGGGGGGGGSIGSASRIVIFGDSLTAGIPDDGAERLWPEILEARLGSGVEVLSYAHPGDTAAASLDRWRGIVEGGGWHPRDSAWEPELVILLLGGNDILRRAGRENLHRDLEAWANALGRHPGLRVLMIEVPSNLLTGSYSGTWAAVARGREGFYWMEDRTLRNILGNRSLTLADGIHLNQEGHEALADGVHHRLVR